MSLANEFTHDGTHVRIDGPAGAPVVVLAHALATDLSFWDLQVAVWSRVFRVVRYDLRGHGQSQAPAGPYGFEQMVDEVTGLLDYLKVDKAAFVGLSLGGMIGQALALRAPQRLTALVLAETNARTPEALKGMWQQRIAGATSGGMETQIEGSLARWFTPDYRTRSPLTVEWITSLIRQTQPAGFIACCRAIENLDFLDRLTGVSVPTLVVAGAEDQAAPLANLQGIAAKIPGSTFVKIAGAAHLGNIEQSSVFSEEVGAFLKAHLLR
ncbi:MAG: 3-oxoadipate enol-lactonase [Steroidobacteraceae bacterium]